MRAREKESTSDSLTGMEKREKKKEKEWDGGWGKEAGGRKDRVRV